MVEHYPQILASEKKSHHHHPVYSPVPKVLGKEYRILYALEKEKIKMCPAMFQLS